MASHRLWRVRKKYDHIDAEVERRAAGWELRIIRNGRRLLSWPFPTRAAASAEADARLRELERSGWRNHW
jgi:hypothetical protein